MASSTDEVPSTTNPLVEFVGEGDVFPSVSEVADDLQQSTKLDETAGQVAFSLLSAFILLVLIPISVFYAYKFWTYRHHTVIIKRYGILTMHNVCILILHLLNIALLSLTLPNVLPLSPVLVWIEHFTSLASCWLPAMRFYHLMLDMRYISKLMTHQWQQIICDTSTTTLPASTPAPFTPRSQTKPSLAPRQSTLVTAGGTNEADAAVSAIDAEEIPKRSFSFAGADTASDANTAASGDTDGTDSTAATTGGGTQTLLRRGPFASYKVTCYYIVYPMLFIVPSIVVSGVLADNLVLLLSIVLALYLVPSICFVYLWVLLKYFLKFEDAWFVGSELRRLFWIYVMCVLWIIASAVTVAVVVDVVEQLNTYQAEIWTGWICFLLLILALVVFAEILVLTRWVLQRIEPLLNSKHFIHSYNDKSSLFKNNYANPVQTDQFVADALHALRSQSERRLRKSPRLAELKASIVREVTLSDVLSDQKALNVFLRHLAREWSMEGLISLIEFIFFENYVFNYLVRNPSLIKVVNEPPATHNGSKHTFTLSFGQGPSLGLNGFNAVRRRPSVLSIASITSPVPPGDSAGATDALPAAEASVLSVDVTQLRDPSPEPSPEPPSFPARRDSIEIVERPETNEMKNGDQIGSARGRTQSSLSVTGPKRTFVSKHKQHTSSMAVVGHFIKRVVSNLSDREDDDVSQNERRDTIRSETIKVDENESNIEFLKSEKIGTKYRIKFPKSVPKSSIVFEKHGQHGGKGKDVGEEEASIWLEEAKIKSHKLYKKYIAVGSAYEINISFKQRTELINLMDDIDVFLSNDDVNEMKLFYLFQGCCKEMIFLLQGSFYRFKKSAYFDKFVQDCNFGSVGTLGSHA